MAKLTPKVPGMVALRQGDWIFLQSTGPGQQHWALRTQKTGSWFFCSLSGPESVTAPHPEARDHGRLA